jgi:hypothetical protein
MKTIASITIKKVGSDKEEVDVTYKMEKVGTEEEAQTLIKLLDEQFSKDGAQTALTNWSD